MISTKNNLDSNVVFTDNENNFQYEPNRSYRGSARVDDEGNFAFRPYRECTEQNPRMQWLSGGSIGRNYHWALHRSPHTVRITLTIKEFDQLISRPKKVTEILRNLFVKALYEISNLL